MDGVIFVYPYCALVHPHTPEREGRFGLSKDQRSFNDRRSVNATDIPRHLGGILLDDSLDFLKVPGVFSNKVRSEERRVGKECRL